MASTTKVTASSGSINWEEVKRGDPEAYYEFHDDDGQLNTLALLRGIHNIQTAGGSGADEQQFLDQMGFKPLPDSAAPAAAEELPPPHEQREARHQARLRDEQQRMQSAIARTRDADSPFGVYEGSALSRDVANLTAVVADLDVPGAPPAITLPQAFVSERAFAAHVEGRVREAVATEQATFAVERAEWKAKLLAENRLLKAVLRKYDVSIVDARAALAALDAAESGEAEPPMAHPVSPATALSARVPMERDPSYVRFATMASRGRPRHRRKRGGAWCAP